MKLIGSRVLINFGSKPVKTRYSVLSSKSAQNWYYTLYVCTMFFFQLSWNITNLRLSEWVALKIERILVLELILQIPAGPGVHHDNHEIQHKFLVFWWLWEQHTRFNTRLNIWVAIWRCVALPRPLNLQNIANLWTNGLQNCKNLGSSAIACRSHHFVGKQIC